jgi:AraC-like DNA-binding protein
MSLEDTYFWGITATVYVVTCFMFSAVRWFHTCNKPKESHTYIWPDRKLQSIIYLMPVFLLPFIKNPADDNTWLMWKSYFPATYYFFSGIMLFCFFGTVKQWNQWKGISWFAGAVVVLTMMPLIVNAWIPGCILHPSQWGGQFYLYIVTVVSLLMMCYCGVAMWQVWQWMEQSSDENYSNPDDFPSSYAHRVWLAPVMLTPFVWPAFLTDSHIISAICNLVLSLANVVLLLTVLQAWRKLDIFTETKQEEVEEAEAPANDSFQESIMNDRMQKIAKFIDEYVNKQQNYLNPHLKIENVVSGCGYSRTYVSKVFKEYYGGFFNYVNSLRLAHYVQYAANHPAITKEATALASGFTSYQCYYKVRERMKELKVEVPTS